MGCECIHDKGDQDLLTSKADKFRESRISIPEDEEVEIISIPQDLSNIINKKLRRKTRVPPKFFGISEDDFTSILNRNCFAEPIIKLYSSQIDAIDYEIDVKYKDVTPIKVLDPEGGIQYYKGGFNKDGQCHGKGIWIKDYNIYIGNFRNDEFHGVGLFINEQGDYYFGQWKNSQCNGFGSIMMEKKLVYQGNFANSKKEGYGEERYPDGDMYKGAFYDGQKSGRGQYIFADGSRYDGNFKNSKYSGFGQISFSNGNTVRGDFKNGKLNGEGDFTWADGSKFVGNFLDNQKSGEGTYIWGDGKSYKGQFNGNSAYGTGLLKDPIKRTQESIVID